MHENKHWIIDVNNRPSYGQKEGSFSMREGICSNSCSTPSYFYLAFCYCCYWNIFSPKYFFYVLVFTVLIIQYLISREFTRRVTPLKTVLWKITLCAWWEMWLYYNFTIPMSFSLVTLVTGQSILLETISYCLSEKHTMKYTAKIKEMLPDCPVRKHKPVWIYFTLSFKLKSQQAQCQDKNNWSPQKGMVLQVVTTD